LIHISKTHIVAFLLIAASLLFGQNGDLQNRFNQGLVFYQNNDLTQAQYIFSELCDSSSDNPLVTSALLMAAKTSYSLREYDQAISYCTRLIKDYEASRYRAHAYYVRGAAYFRDGNFGTAAQELTFAVEFAESEKLLKLAESTATNIVVGYIGKSTLNKIYSAYPWKQAHPILTIWRAHFARQTGDEGTAEQMLQTLLASNPAPRYKIIAQQLSAGETAQNKHVVRIGIIQPLAGYFSEEANDFLKGMAFSLHKRKNMQSVIELVLKETDGSIVETIKAAQQLPRHHRSGRAKIGGCRRNSPTSKYSGHYSSGYGQQSGSTRRIYFSGQFRYGNARYDACRVCVKYAKDEKLCHPRTGR